MRKRKNRGSENGKKKKTKQGIDKEQVKKKENEIVVILSSVEKE